MLGSLPSNQSSDFHCLQPAARVFIFKSELYRVILLLEILKGLSILLMPANEPKTQRKLNQKSQSACHPLSRSTICSRPSTGLMSQHSLSQVQFLQATGFPDILQYAKHTPTSQSSEHAGSPARILYPGYPFLTTQSTFMLVTVYPQLYSDNVSSMKIELLSLFFSSLISSPHTSNLAHNGCSINSCGMIQ